MFLTCLPAGRCGSKIFTHERIKRSVVIVNGQGENGDSQISLMNTDFRNSHL